MSEVSGNPGELKQAAGSESNDLLGGNVCRGCGCNLIGTYTICGDCEKDEILDALKTAWDAMCERRGYSEAWEWKYGNAWNEEDEKVKRAIETLNA